MSCTAARSEPERPRVSFRPSRVSAATNAPKSDAYRLKPSWACFIRSDSAPKPPADISRSTSSKSRLIGPINSACALA
ncbi:hypothetical protein ACVWWL_005260 [Bradyrhizobium sp. USDA 3696]